MPQAAVSLPVPVPARQRLIVALDAPELERSRLLRRTLGPAASFYKVGLGSLAQGGLDFAREIKAEGGRVFLDLKLFDIGATVEAAVRSLARGIAPDFLTVHADPPVVRAAAEGRGGSAVKILAVTILTSLDRADLDSMLIRAGDLEDLVVERARRAFAAGADGLIASPHEAARLRALPEAAGKLIVTPGVRPTGADHGDQKRVATPAAALAAGADHLVVGRPVWAAADPRAAAEAVQAEIAEALG
ncbi:orotidine-5'-phosphate decarboxylase [Neomegalonema sp.]|uniref:orotidine-5'-phosphate decarboxylase n=1 Tax=Neomegalonema sp. TaxID=2039713 RepID=UPI0026020A26|nr:orotidine-5'-phosphate decarboxylase [Neomegalonema sp.]MDD2868939.1 orotidine-5'-phosphate decarboxylase [Neomegalonema sp.]